MLGLTCTAAPATDGGSGLGEAICKTLSEAGQLISGANASPERAPARYDWNGACR
jgi:hypothetical protein